MKTPSDSVTQAVLEVTGLSRSYGGKAALKDVTLRVPRGVVFGLVGENGAGKTTLIKHVLGLLKAETGNVRVFGLNPVAHPVEVLGRIGYLSEDRDLPGWMRVQEVVRYTQAFYPLWDAAYAERLRLQFNLAADARVKSLSRGETAKLGLLLALAHRPELMVLDEPSSGLDPVVRRDILEAIIRTIAEEGRTVIFSSHLLEEVERISDVVAMIHQGAVALCGTLEEIKENHHRLVLHYEKTPEKPPAPEGALSVSGAGREWTIICNGARAQVVRAAQQTGARIVEEGQPSLDEIFVARVGQGKL